MKKHITLIFALCVAFVGCEYLPRIPLYWKTYEHPTYRFTMKVPRLWQIQPAGVMGAQVVFLEADDDPVFRANLNVVIQGRTSKQTLEELAVLSAKQLRFLLKEYQLLSRGMVRLANTDAFELRGRYRGLEGSRIIRTIVALTNTQQYVLTYSCREERELALQPIVQEMIASFLLPTNLSSKK